MSHLKPFHLQLYQPLLSTQDFQDLSNIIYLQIAPYPRNGKKIDD